MHINRLSIFMTIAFCVLLSSPFVVCSDMDPDAILQEEAEERLREEVDQVESHVEESDMDIPEDAEAGFDEDLPKTELLRPHSLDTFIEKAQERDDIRNKGYKINAANAGVEAASRRSNSRKKFADDTREAGGQEAQRIKEETARSISSADEADSWKNTLMDAVEHSVQTGMVIFGEVLGEEAAEEAVGAPRRDHRHDGHDHHHDH